MTGGSESLRVFYDCEFIEMPSTIDLISIGMVTEDGRELYRCHGGCDLSRASDWVRDNVAPQLPPRHSSVWVRRDELRHDILDFLRPSKKNKVELWGYYSAYDHVALCWIFGCMVDLPEGMPKYTRDLKQWCDSLGNPKLPQILGNKDHNALNDARWNREAYWFLKAYQKLADDEKR